MTKIDQFESVFKAADKVLFSHEGVLISSVLVITDLDEAAAQRFLSRMQAFLGVLPPGQTQWQVLSGDRCPSVPELLHFVDQSHPQLICTYRNLRIPARQYPTSRP